MADETTKKYPKTLSAPVDVETWEWFTAQADALDRTVGAQLRRVILAHRHEVEEGYVAVQARFADAVARQISVDGETHNFRPGGAEAVPAVRPVRIELPDDDPEEGVT